MTNHPNRSKQQQAKHTPGPWHIENRSVNGCNLGIYDTSGNVVAAIDATPITLPRKRSDAFVIGAAPELLAALKRMVEAYREGVQDDREPMAVRQALAAIAKAEGRVP